MTKLNWKLVLVHLEIVLILTLDRCTVCTESTIRYEIIFAHPMELLGDVGHVESRSIRLEKVLVLMEDWCTVCAKRTIGSDIVLDTPYGTPS